MDSSNWSDQQRRQAAEIFAKRVRESWKSSQSRTDRRRGRVAAHLSVAIADSGITRAKVADRAGMKPSQLTRQLSGDVNLTLDSIGRICEAIGYDFDVLLRKVGDPVAKQPWERTLDRTDVFHRVFERAHRRQVLVMEGVSAGQAANDDSLLVAKLEAA